MAKIFTIPTGGGTKGPGLKTLRLPSFSFCLCVIDLTNMSYIVLSYLVTIKRLQHNKEVTTHGSFFRKQRGNPGPGPSVPPPGGIVIFLKIAYKINNILLITS